MIDWNFHKNEMILNPRMPSQERDLLYSELSKLNMLQNHVWLATSGSSGTIKCVALSKEALLNSAEAVNKHLEVVKTDIWLNPLPFFHVGGLGIWARGYLSQSKVIDWSANRWNPLLFTESLKDNKISLTSMVPTQIYDLVLHKIPAPESLRAVIVGGGALNEDVYNHAINLGWKLLPSYGLTECASQVATALLESWKSGKFPLMKPLNHVDIQLNKSGFLKIKSSSLLSVYAIFVSNQLVVSDPKNEGWFVTEDKATLVSGCIANICRQGDWIKIGGENVDLKRLEKILETEKLKAGIQDDITLWAASDLRLGHTIHLVIAGNSSEVFNHLIANFNSKVFPFEKIRKIHYLDVIPRSPLGKVLIEDLQRYRIF